MEYIDNRVVVMVIWLVCSFFGIPTIIGLVMWIIYEKKIKIHKLIIDPKVLEERIILEKEWRIAYKNWEQDQIDNKKIPVFEDKNHTRYYCVTLGCTEEEEE